MKLKANKEYNQNRIAQYFIVLMLSILLSIVFTIIINNFDSTKGYINNINSKTTILKSDDFIFFNYNKNDNEFISTSNDGQLIKNGINTKINDIKISFNELVTENIPIVIYFTKNEEVFNEEMTRRAEITSGNKEIIIPIDNYVKDLRIDIGNQIGQKFKINEITINNKGNFGLTLNLEINKNTLIEIFLLFILFVFLGLHWILGLKKLYNFIFKYRFIIAICVIAVATLLELSGSSIGMWNQYIQEPYEERHDTVFGNPRPIRSDEWDVNTPFALSQVNSGSSYFNNIVRGTKSDMYIVYGQPVKDISIIFRPFQIGYLLFGGAKGLAFFWTSRLVVLFLVTFEFGRLLLKKNNLLSVTLAIMVTFSPLIQWWFAVNGLVEMIIFGELAILLIYNYMNTDNYKKRLIYAAILPICAGGYILTFYPTWQVPLGYMFLGFLIWIVIDNWKNFKWSKKDLLLLLYIILFLCIGLGHILIKSWDTIKIVLNTAYPGKRIALGDGGFDNLFRYPGNIFHGITDLNIPNNVCEMSGFYSFFPLSIILSFIILIKDKIKDKFLIIMLIINFILLGWCLFPWSTLIAKATLLSFAPTDRVVPILELINLFILFRGIYLFKGLSNKYIKILSSIIITAFVMYVCINNYGNYFNYKMVVFSTLILFFSIIIILNINKNNFYKKAFLSICLVVSFLGGIIVNPIQSGLSPIYDKKITKAIRGINEKEEGLWLVENKAFPINNLPIMVGASTLNSTNVYPNLELWERLDPQGKYVDIYNRYAHILVEIMSDKPTYFELLGADIFKVYLNIEDLKKINVDYIFTYRDLNNIQFNLVYLDGNYKIYKVNR